MNSYENVIVDNLFVYFKHFLRDLIFTKGRVQKPQLRKMSVMGGGYPPFPLSFFRQLFGQLLSVMGGGGVPPFSVMKKSVENWPKNSVF